jgi:hypothetical protein
LVYSRARKPFREKIWGKGHKLEVLLGNDLLRVNHEMGFSYYCNKEEYTTERGIRWKKVRHNTARCQGYYTEIVEHSLGDDGAIDSYVSPNPEKIDFSPMQKVISGYGREYFIIGGIGCSLWEA